MNRRFTSLVALCILLSTTISSAESFSAADVYRASAPSVVLIFGFNSKGDGSAGTGSIISKKGLILTNNHVIYDATAREARHTSSPASAAPGIESVRSSPRSSGEGRARSYRTRDGEMAFGVPNVKFDLEGTLGEMIAQAKKHARDAFDELDNLGTMDGGFDEEGF